MHTIGPRPAKPYIIRPAGLGPLYYLCPVCHGTGGDPEARAPRLVAGSEEELMSPAHHRARDGKCTRCDGKGEVLEDRSLPARG